MKHYSNNEYNKSIIRQMKRQHGAYDALKMYLDG